MEKNEIEKQIDIVEEFQIKMYDLEVLDDDLHSKLEDAIDEVLRFYRNALDLLHSPDEESNEELCDRFNYENFDRRMIS